MPMASAVCRRELPPPGLGGLRHGGSGGQCVHHPQTSGWPSVPLSRASFVPCHVIQQQFGTLQSCRPGWTSGCNALVRPQELKNRKCPYCEKEFKPSRSHRDQKVCSSDDCQRQRRADYHRRKLSKDPLYRALCEDSQKTWKERNPDYMRQYRASQRDTRLGRPAPGRAVRELERLLSHIKNNLVKNTSAFRVKRCGPGCWMVSPVGPGHDKNTSCPTQVIMIQGIMPGEKERGAREQRSGNPARPAV